MQRQQNLCVTYDQVLSQWPKSERIYIWNVRATRKEQGEQTPGKAAHYPVMVRL